MLPESMFSKFSLCVECCTCQDIILIDGPFPSNEEEHGTIRAPPVCLVHKEPLEERKS